MMLCLHAPADPYGYHNFIMTFFDDPAGVGNLPWPASWQVRRRRMVHTTRVDAERTAPPCAPPTRSW